MQYFFARACGIVPPLLVPRSLLPLNCFGTFTGDLLHIARLCFPPFWSFPLTGRPVLTPTPHTPGSGDASAFLRFESSSGFLCPLHFLLSAGPAGQPLVSCPLQSSWLHRSVETAVTRGEVFTRNLSLLPVQHLTSPTTPAGCSGQPWAPLNLTPRSSVLTCYCSWNDSPDLFLGCSFFICRNTVYFMWSYVVQPF